jgi:hypothetical protein
MDRYDREIKRLTESPEKIIGAWRECMPLFEYASHDGHTEDLQHGCVGCLTMIRQDDGMVAQTPELTAAIRADERLPTSGQAITVESLPAFAEWQRKLDALYPGRNPENAVAQETP